MAVTRGPLALLFILQRKDTDGQPQALFIQHTCPGLSNIWILWPLNHLFVTYSHPFPLVSPICGHMLPTPFPAPLPWVPSPLGNLGARLYGEELLGSSCLSIPGIQRSWHPNTFPPALQRVIVNFPSRETDPSILLCRKGNLSNPRHPPPLSGDCHRGGVRNRYVNARFGVSILRVWGNQADKGSKPWHC